MLCLAERVRPLEQSGQSLVVAIHPGDRVVDQPPQHQERSERERADAHEQRDHPDLAPAIFEARKRIAVDHQRKSDQRNDGAEEVDDERGRSARRNMLLRHALVAMVLTRGSVVPRIIALGRSPESLARGARCTQEGAKNGWTCGSRPRR